jgi:hypothetical protein
MIKGETSHEGLFLITKNTDTLAIRDLFKIRDILLENKVKVGGYSREECDPEIEIRDGKSMLDLGR